jgi:hypothetical protein
MKVKSREARGSRAIWREHFAVEGGLQGGELLLDLREAFDAEAGACFDEGFARGRGFERGGMRLYGLS